MLRREPTKITLTAEDVAAYDLVKAQKDQQKRRQQQASMAAQDPFVVAGQNNNQAARSKEQRIGLSNTRQ